MDTQRRENMKLNFIHISLIQSRLCHCYLKYPTLTRHCQKRRITNYSVLINKNGTSAPVFILLLPLVLTMEKNAGEFTNSLLVSSQIHSYTHVPALLYSLGAMLQLGAEIPHLSTQEEPTFSHSPKGRFISLSVTSKTFFISLNRSAMNSNKEKKNPLYSVT